MDMCLYPDYKIASKHALRISNSLKIIVASLLEHCDPEERLHYLNPMLDRLLQSEGSARFTLVDALFYLPLGLLPLNRRQELTELLLAAGCTEVQWLMPEESGFYQPVLIARAGNMR
jgi:hypothetical protein